MLYENEQGTKTRLSLRESPIWSDDGLFKLYHYCLHKASRNLYVWHGVQIRPGEFPMSFRHAAEELCWSRDKLIRKFARLEQAGYVSLKKGRSGTLVRIIKWNEIQTRATCRNSPPRSENEYMHGTESRPYWFERTTSVGMKHRPNIGGNKKEYIHSPIYADGFGELWLAYPEERRTRRAEAEQLYDAAISHGATQEAIMAALNTAKQSMSWRMDDGQFIPGIVTWLQKETWRDFVKPAEHQEVIKWTSR